MGLLRKWPGPKHRVRLNQVSALEGVRFNQVSLYIENRNSKFADSLIVLLSATVCVHKSLRRLQVSVTIVAHNTGTAVSTFRILQKRRRNVAQNTGYELSANYSFPVILLRIIQ